jgi:HAD superfamily hydrolase (TIGR01509 family)
MRFNLYTRAVAKSFANSASHASVPKGRGPCDAGETGLRGAGPAASVPAFMQLDIPPGDFAGYIFDLDGTLIDTMPIHYLAWERAIRAIGLQGRLDEDRFYALGGMPSVQVAALLGAHHGLTVADPVAVAEEKERLYVDYLAGGGVVPHLAPVVEFARRVAATRPVAIATGGTPDVALPALAAAGLTALFPVVVTPHDVAPGRGKPHPDMFLEAARRIGVEPGACLVFEDAEPGLRAARAAGMQVVRVASRLPA